MRNILADDDDRIRKVFDLERGIPNSDVKGISLWRSGTEFTSSYSKGESDNELSSSKTSKRSWKNGFANDKGMIFK